MPAWLKAYIAMVVLAYLSPVFVEVWELWKLGNPWRHVKRVDWPAKGKLGR